MINSSRLQVHLEIARLGSIAAAAEALELSPSAVSHQLATLEREIGVALVERGPRSLSLTPAGVRLADYAQQVVDLMAAAHDDLAAHGRAASGVLHCGFFATAGIELLPRALSMFSAARPGVEVDLVLGQPHELVPRLERRDLDLVVVFEQPLDPMSQTAACDVAPLLRDPQRLVLPARHPLATRPRLRLEDLVRESWITTRGTEAGMSVLERAAMMAGFQPRIRCRSDHYEVTLALVRAGIGVALVPSLALQDERELVVRELEQPELYREIGVATRRNNPNPTVGAFTEYLRDAASTLSREIDADRSTTEP